MIHEMPRVNSIGPKLALARPIAPSDAAAHGWQLFVYTNERFPVALEDHYRFLQITGYGRYPSGLIALWLDSVWPEPLVLYFATRLRSCSLALVTGSLVFARFASNSNLATPIPH
ncbi:hypothetical protein AFLA_003387 [Aspergillus flavus NRRL3357]|nr:hypothetical protein AFLA_003387 [Aspergillus flavus NRRL3357]